MVAPKKPAPAVKQDATATQPAKVEPLKQVTVEYTLHAAQGETPSKGKAHATHHRYSADGYPMLYIGGAHAPRTLRVTGLGLAPASRKARGTTKAKAEAKVLREALIEKGMTEDQIEEMLKKAS